MKLAINGGSPVRREPFPEWPVYSEAEIKAVTDVLKSRRWCRGKVYGAKKCLEFEDKFARFHGTKYGLAVTNGTQTLEIALKALGIGPGDEVIVPDYTFIATAMAVLCCNAVPIPVDVDPDTYCIDPEEIERAVTRQTKAIIPVHLAGNMCDMNEIMRIARKHRLYVIEDAAQAHGASYRDRMAGSIGHIASFSFQVSKCMTAGEGGILISNNKKLMDRCFSVNDAGRIAAKPSAYYHDSIGSNCRMTEMQGAILLEQLKRLKSQTKRRNENGLYLNKELSGIPGIVPQRRTPETTRQSYFVYAFRYSRKEFGNLSKKLFLRALNAEGIPTHNSWPLVHKTPVFQKRNFWSRGCPLSCSYYKGKIDYSKLNCPNAEKIVREVIFFENSVLLGKKKDMEDIVRAICKIRSNLKELKKKR